MTTEKIIVLVYVCNLTKERFHALRFWSVKPTSYAYLDVKRENHDRGKSVPSSSGIAATNDQGAHAMTSYDLLVSIVGPSYIQVLGWYSSCLLHGFCGRGIKKDIRDIVKLRLRSLDLLWVIFGFTTTTSDIL